MTPLAETKARRLAVFGGSFNPPHRGHEELVASLLERDLADELWIVPVYEHPFGKLLADFDDRLAMCRLAFGRFGDRVRISEIERELGGPSFTVRTLESLKRRFPEDRLELVVGADTLKDTDHWHDFERVRALALLLVVPRAGERAPRGNGVLDLPQPPDVSSSEVRRRLAAGESVAGMLSEAVERYAVGRGLYRPSVTGANGSANRTDEAL